MNRSRLHLRLFLLLNVLLSGLTSCKDTDTNLPAPPDMGYEYFPLKPGQRSFYHVDSIAWNDFRKTVDTFSYQLKDTITGLIYNELSGDSIFLMDRYQRENAFYEWSFSRTITLIRQEKRAEYNDENTPYVKMVFPVSAGITWNGNAYNSLPPQDYRYLQTGAAYMLPDGSNTPATLVRQLDNQNRIREEYAEETYGKDFGLLKRYVKMLDKDINTGAITSGYIYLQVYTGN